MAVLFTLHYCKSVLQTARYGVIVIDNSNSKYYDNSNGNSNRQSSNSISNSNIKFQCCVIINNR